MPEAAPLSDVAKLKFDKVVRLAAAVAFPVSAAALLLDFRAGTLQAGFERGKVV